jgi:hypothetical protein
MGVYSSRFKLVVPGIGTTCYKSSTKQDLFEPLSVGRDTQLSSIPTTPRGRVYRDGKLHKYLRLIDAVR